MITEENNNNDDEIKFFITDIQKDPDGMYSIYIKDRHIMEYFPINSILYLINHETHPLIKEHFVKFSEEKLFIYDNMFRKLSFNEMSMIFNVNRNSDQEEIFVRIKGEKSNVEVWKKVFELLIEDLKEKDKNEEMKNLKEFDLEGFFLVKYYEMFLSNQREEKLIKDLNNHHSEINNIKINKKNKI